MNKKPPTILIILDGFGHAGHTQGNSIAQARLPFWRSCMQEYPHTLLNASGKAVGLPEGYMGNSQVGHRTIGAGRIIPTILQRFNRAIVDERLSTLEPLRATLQEVKHSTGRLHLAGLVSDAGVHSHENHLHALIKCAAEFGIHNIIVHAFLDGRDTPPQSALTYLNRLSAIVKRHPGAEIASIHGRFYAMDRDKNWDRTRESYDVLTNQRAKQPYESYEDALGHFYNQNITDEFVPPTRLLNNGFIQKGDGIIFFNLRPDRARQLTSCFLDPDFSDFQTNGLTIKSGTLAGMLTVTDYDPQFAQWGATTLFKREVIEHTLLDEISQQNKENKKCIFTIAETEKYAHVTYFIRGEHEEKLENETRVLIPSLKERNYVEHPEMSAREITHTILNSLKKDPHLFYLINYANADMVGHSGDQQATIRACEVLDEQLKMLFDEVVERQGGTIFITADHGNAEEMLDKSGKPKTAHTTNPVPFLVLTQKKDAIKMASPLTLGLSHIAPTLLQFMQLHVPGEMEQLPVRVISLR